MEPEMQKQQSNENSVQPPSSNDAQTEIREDGDSSLKSVEHETSGEERQVKAELEAEKEEDDNDCVIDVEKAENICRICHLSSENMELIQLGCGCKDQLGVSHLQCAQTWFNHRGNRQCEICGKTAKNVTGIQETRMFAVDWNEIRLMRSSANSSSREGGSCHYSQSCCNFLLACFILAFILPWFFRVDTM